MAASTVPAENAREHGPVAYTTVVVLVGLLLYVAFMLVMLGVLKVAKRADEQSEGYYRSVNACHVVPPSQGQVRTRCVRNRPDG
jgi:hypothetical protein